MEELARILIYGDIHLSSRNYGGHRDYPNESLSYFKDITRYTEELKATHLIGLGDFTFNRFNTLEYREKVERELNKQFELVSGNRYELKGNHDIAPYGMTEYEYYVNRGLLKPATDLKIGNVNIYMANYNEYDRIDIASNLNEGEINILLAHNYFKFEDTKLGNYGKAIILDNYVKWYGLDYLILGHIHNNRIFNGNIIKNGIGHELIVHYLGCMSRPKYREGLMDDEGHLAFIVIYDNGEVDYDVIQHPLWDLEKSFNLVEINKRYNKKQVSKVDISDIVAGLDQHKDIVDDPYLIIKSLNVDERYKNKAIEYLKDDKD